MAIETTDAPVGTVDEPPTAAPPVSPVSEQWLPYYAAAERRSVSLSGNAEAHARYRLAMGRRVLFALAMGLFAVVAVGYLALR